MQFVDDERYGINDQQRYSLGGGIRMGEGKRSAACTPAEIGRGYYISPAHLAR